MTAPKLCGARTRAGDLDTRLVVLEHQRGQLVPDLVLRVLENRDIDLDASQLTTARALVATELRALSTDTA